MNEWQVSEVAKEILGYLMLRDKKAKAARLTVMSSAPGWVNKVLNGPRNQDGIFDQERQVMIFETLKMMGAMVPPSRLRTPSSRVLGRWLNACPTRNRADLVRLARRLGAPKGREREAAYAMERLEVSLQTAHMIVETALD